jgi:hypothetical protein
MLQSDDHSNDAEKRSLFSKTCTLGSNSPSSTASFYAHFARKPQNERQCPLVPLSACFVSKNDNLISVKSGNPTVDLQ